MTDEHHDPTDVELREDEQRFVVERDGLVAELVYVVDGDRMTLLHDGVPSELERHGIGGALVQRAIEWAAAEGLTVVPRCPFARRWLRQHPEVAATVRIDWSHGPSSSHP